MTRRRTWLGLALLALGALVWQIRPLLIWHLRVERELRAGPGAERLDARTERSFPAPPDGWLVVESGPLTLRAPVAGGPEACESCGEGCRLALARGRLTLFGGPDPPRYREALRRLAPDASDLRWLGSREANWGALHALVNRASLPHDPPETFRFEAAGSRGLVARFANRGIERFVIYAYALDDAAPAPVVALSGSGGEVLRRVLGSLRVEGGGGAHPGSRCRRG